MWFHNFYRIIFRVTDKNLSSIIDRSFNSNPSFRRVEKIKSIESRYPISTFIDFLSDTHARFAGRGNSGGDNLHLFMIHEAGTGQQQSGNLLKTSTIRDPEILTRNRSRNRDVSRRKWPHLHAAWMCVAVDRFWLTGRGREKKEQKKKKCANNGAEKGRRERGKEGKGRRRWRFKDVARTRVSRKLVVTGVCLLFPPFSRLIFHVIFFFPVGKKIK